MEKPLTQHIKPNREPLTIEEYEKVGGYAGLRQALRMSPKEVQEVVTQVQPARPRGRRLSHRREVERAAAGGCPPPALFRSQC